MLTEESGTSAFSARRERPPAPFLLRRLRRAGGGDGDSHPSDREGELDGGVAWKRRARSQRLSCQHCDHTSDLDPFTSGKLGS